MATELKTKEKDLLLNLIDSMKDQQGALIPILQAAQQAFGHLGEETLQTISQQLGQSYSEVAGVVSFYSYFTTTPRGKHVVRVCLGTACYVRGGKQLLADLKKQLDVKAGGTTEDGLFTLEIGRCFGACGLAPAVMIDDQVYQRVTTAKLKEILQSYRDLEAEKADAGVKA